MERTGLKLKTVTIAQLLSENDLNGSALEKIYRKDPNSKTVSGAHFYHYTTEERIKKILDRKEKPGKGCFYVNSISHMNDEQEKELHKADGDKVFALCFSQQKEENIPLWYLYGGIMGKGARIDFTSAKMIDLIKGIKYVFPVINNVYGIPMPDESNPLEKGKDFDFSCGWVYYCKNAVKDSDRIDKIMFRNDLYWLKGSYTEFSRDNYYVKDYPWNYEKEFRLLFKFKEKAPSEQIAFYFDRDIFAKARGIKIMLAPNAEKSEEDRRHLANTVGLKETQIENSKLKIHFDLFKRNKEDIAKQVADVIRDLT